MKNILVVEDDIEIQDCITRAIQSLNTNIHIIKTPYGEEALKLAYDIQIDIFIIDINLLDDYSGITLAKKIREIYRYQLTPIIFETSDVAKELKAFRQTSCSSYIIKPFAEKKIVLAIQKALFIAAHYTIQPKKIQFMQGRVSCTYIVDSILYIESLNQNIEIVSYNEHHKKIEKYLLKRYALKKILEDLADNNFIRCHRGFVINKAHVKRIDWLKNCILLEYTDQQIPIGDMYRKNLN